MTILPPVPAHPAAATSYDWGDCTPLFSRAAVTGAPGYDIGINRIVLNPGARGTPHRHQTAEYLTFLSGTGKVYVEGLPPAQVYPQTTVTIRPNVLHHVENTDDGAQLIYIAIRVGPHGNAIADEIHTPHGCPPTVIK